MSEDDTVVNFARLMILDEELTRKIFFVLRTHYADKEPDVKYILNLLEATILNAITERKLFFNALTLALKTDEEKQKIQGEIDQALIELQNKIHSVDKDVKELKTGGVEDIVRKYLGGNQ